MRALILAILLVGVLSNTFCGPVNPSAGLNQKNQTPRLAILTTKLPSGVAGRYYIARLTGAGGTPPYRWEIPEGSLPDGLELDRASGEISGIPKQLMWGFVTLTVIDSTKTGPKHTTTFVPLVIDPDHFTILTDRLPRAVVGKPYTAKLDAAGGAEPFTWSLKEGFLPSGLELGPHSGIISGKPTQAGTSVFVVQATDSSNPPMSVAYRFSP